MKKQGEIVNAMRIEESIQALELYVDSREITSLLAAMKVLKTDPQNDTYFESMENAFDNLGIEQGAVLTYAPYLSVLLSEALFKD